MCTPLAPTRVGHIPAVARAHAQATETGLTPPRPVTARDCLRLCLMAGVRAIKCRRAREPRRRQPRLSHCVIVSSSCLTALVAPLRADTREA
jgi:hypothetical protein